MFMGCVGLDHPGAGGRGFVLVGAGRAQFGAPFQAGAAHWGVGVVGWTRRWAGLGGLCCGRGPAAGPEILDQIVVTAMAALGIEPGGQALRSEERTSELQSRGHLVCRLLLEK